MKTLGSHAGYLLIDHRDSPGLTAADVAHVPGALPVAAGARLERDVKQCSHCQRTVVLEPARVRQRGYCPKCDHYLCDGCEAIRAKTGACVPFAQVLDRAATIAERFSGDPTHPDAAVSVEALATETPRIVLTDSVKET